MLRKIKDFAISLSWIGMTLEAMRTTTKQPATKLFHYHTPSNAAPRDATSWSKRLRSTPTAEMTKRTAVWQRRSATENS
jgi:hypothetical protein